MTPEQTLDLVLQIATMTGRDAEIRDIAERIGQRVTLVERVQHALPGEAWPKFAKHRQVVHELARTILAHPDAIAWAHHTLGAAQTGISFHTPESAANWIAPCGRRLKFDAELRCADPGRWGPWAKTAILLGPRTGRDRLLLIPRSSDGARGMRLCRAAAHLILVVHAVGDPNNAA